MSRVLTRNILVGVMAAGTALGFLAPAADAGAEETKAAARYYSKQYAECRETALRGIDLWGCAVDEALQQDRRMNLAYRQLMKRLPAAQAAGVQRSQRAWIVQRDRECHAPNLAFGDFNPGDDDTPDPWCVVDKTALRTAWLERYRK